MQPQSQLILAQLRSVECMGRHHSDRRSSYLESVILSTLENASGSYCYGTNYDQIVRMNSSNVFPLATEVHTCIL